MTSVVVSPTLIRSPIDSYEKMVFICIQGYANGWMSIRQIARDLRISRKKASASVRRLHEVKMISRRAVVKDNRVQTFITVNPESQWSFEAVHDDIYDSESSETLDSRFPDLKW